MTHSRAVKTRKVLVLSGKFWLFLVASTGFVAGAEGIFFPSVGWASGTEEAEQALAAAQNRYFQALIQGGPKSTAEAQQLEKAIVNPARAEINHILIEKDAEAFRKYSKITTEPYQSFRGADGEGAGAAGAAGNKGAVTLGDFSSDKKRSKNAESPDQANSAKGIVEGDVPFKPVLTLDGSQVPRELEFPGRKPAGIGSLSTSLKVRPAPSVIPEMIAIEALPPGQDQPVQELQFSGPLKAYPPAKNNR